jgi:hypothetical protein
MSPIRTSYSIGLAFVLLLTLVGQSQAAAIPQPDQTSNSIIISSIPNGIDLDVTYISRQPSYEWTASKQWPDPGEAVTFTAHVINKGTNASGTFSYAWYIDGQIVQTGDTGSLTPGSEVTFTQGWSWQSDQHMVGFKADPQNLISETGENNNEIVDVTDAMTLGFWVEQSVYDEFNNHINGIGTYSWEDWAQMIIQHWNWMFEQSVYPLAPEGGLTRVRLDMITIVPDGTLFNQGCCHAPPENVTDGEWGFSIQEYQNCSMNHCFDGPWWVIHELMHYLYGRIDLYAFGVQGGDVKVLDDNGNTIVGTSLLPFQKWDVVYYDQYRWWDLMDGGQGDGVYFSDHTIYSLNNDWPVGQRTHLGWTYVYDLPTETKIRVLDIHDQPLQNFQVSVYQAVGGDGSSGPYSQLFDNVVDILGTTDSQGLFSLGSHPFGDLERWGTPAGVDLIKLHNPVSGNNRYVWLDLPYLNLAYWRGDTDLYIHDIYYSEEPMTLKIQNNQLSFTSIQGSNPIPQEININLIGDGAADYSLSQPTHPWLRTIPSYDFNYVGWTWFAAGPLTFVVDSANLPIGTYTSTVTITTHPKVGDSPQTITVTLRVVPPPTFSDVPMEYWAWDWIERLYDAGITSGCATNPLLYCPERSVTRAEMAVFIERGIHGAAYIPPTGTGAVFADVPLSYWDVNWIEKLYSDHITSGCGTSPLSYCPERSITRAEMAVFLLRAEHGLAFTPPAATGIFADVPTTYWDASWIEQLATEGITAGCGGGNYCPGSPVTRAQMAVFLVKTFNLP